MRSVSLSALGLLAVVASCARNPQVAPASIPVPLASALIVANPSFSVGRVPAGYPPALVPTSPATIVGGMTNGSDIVAVFSDSTRRLPAVMEQLFEQHGYKRPPATPASGFSSASGPYSSFCGDSGTVSVEPLSGANRSFARVTYRREAGSYFCRPRETRAATELALPELKPPAGAFVRGTHGGGGGEGVNSAAELTGTDLSAATILAHYSAQLVAAGWTADPPAVSPRVAAQYFVAKDSSGAAWEGVLTAVGGKTALTASLNMHPRESR